MGIHWSLGAGTGLRDGIFPVGLDGYAAKS